MVCFITASPFIDGAERALLNPDNQLLDRLYAEEDTYYEDLEEGSGF